MQISELITTLGGNPDATSKELLWQGIRGKNPALVFVALGLDCDVDSCITPNGPRPLTAAVANGDLETVRLLRKHKARLGRPDGQNHLPIFLAIQPDEAKTIEMLETLEVRGQQDEDVWPAVSKAIEADLPLVLNWLLEAFPRNGEDAFWLALKLQRWNLLQTIPALAAINLSTCGLHYRGSKVTVLLTEYRCVEWLLDHHARQDLLLGIAKERLANDGLSQEARQALAGTIALLQARIAQAQAA